MTAQTNTINRTFTINIIGHLFVLGPAIPGRAKSDFVKTINKAHVQIRTPWAKAIIEDGDGKTTTCSLTALWERLCELDPNEEVREINRPSKSNVQL